MRKAYTITVPDFDDCTVYAINAGQAKYRLYKDYSEHYECTFREWCKMVTCKRDRTRESLPV